jgi:hypothetical protein
MNATKVARSRSGEAKNARAQTSARKGKSTAPKTESSSDPNKVAETKSSPNHSKGNEPSSAHHLGAQRDNRADKASKAPGSAPKDNRAWAVGEVLMRVPELSSGGASPWVPLGEGVQELGKKIFDSASAAGEAAKELWDNVSDAGSHLPLFPSSASSRPPTVSMGRKHWVDTSQGDEDEEEYLDDDPATATDPTSSTSPVDLSRFKSKRKGLGPPNLPTHVHVDRFDKNMETQSFFNLAYHAREHYRSKQLPGLDAGFELEPSRLEEASKGFEQFFEDLVGPLHESDEDGTQGKAVDVRQFTSDLFTLAKSSEIEAAKQYSEPRRETREERAAASASSSNVVPHIEAIYSERARVDFQKLADGLYSDLFLSNSKEFNNILDQTKSKWAQALKIENDPEAMVGLKISASEQTFAKLFPETNEGTPQTQRDIAIPFSQFFEDFIKRGKFGVSIRYPIDLGVIGTERLKKYADAELEEGYALPEEPAGNIELLYGDGRAADFESFGKELQRRLSSDGVDKGQVVEDMYQRLKDALGLGRRLNGIVGVRLSGSSDAIPVPFESLFDKEVRAPIAGASSFPDDFGAMSTANFEGYSKDVEARGWKLPELKGVPPIVDFSPKADELVSGLERSPRLPKHFVDAQGRVMDIHELFWKVYQTRETILATELEKYPFQKGYSESEKQNKVKNHSERFRQQLGLLWASDARGNKTSEPLDVQRLVGDLYGAATPFDLSLAGRSVGSSFDKDFWMEGSAIDEIDSVTSEDRKYLSGFALQYMIQRQWPPEDGNVSDTLEALKRQVRDALALSHDDDLVGVATVPHYRAFTTPFGRFWDEAFAPKLAASPDFFPLDLNFLAAETTKGFIRDAERQKLKMVPPVAELDMNRDRVMEDLENGKSYPVKYVSFVDPSPKMHENIMNGFGLHSGQLFRESGQIVTQDVRFIDGTMATALRYDVNVIKQFAEMKLQKKVSATEMVELSERMLEEDRISKGWSDEVFKRKKAFAAKKVGEIVKAIKGDDFAPSSIYEELRKAFGGLSKEVYLFDEEEDLLTHLRTQDWIELLGLPLSENSQKILRKDMKTTAMPGAQGLETVKINKLSLKLENGVAQAWNSGSLSEVLDVLNAELKNRKLQPAKRNTPVWLSFGGPTPKGVTVGQLYDYLRKHSKSIESLTKEDADQIRA